MTVTLAAPLDLLAQAGSAPWAAAHATPSAIHPVAASVAGPLTVGEYDERMRQQCADDRDLVTRSGFTAPCDMPQHLVYTAPSGRVHVTDLSEPIAAPLPASTVIDLLETRTPVFDKNGRPAVSSDGTPVTQPQPVLFADDATIRRVVAGFRRAADRVEAERVRYISAANRLTLVSSMKFSVLRPVLTRMLTHRFWISKRYNHRQWQEWAAAWSGTAKVARSASQVELLHTLARLAFHHGGGKLVPSTLVGDLRRAEASVWARGASSKATSTHSAYRSVNDFESAWNELNLTDPLLHERNALAGDIAVGAVTQVTGKVKVALDNTPRFNDSNVWLVIEGQRYRAGRESMLAGADNTLTMVLSIASKWNRTIGAARDTNTTVTIYPQRFNMPTALPRDDNAWLTPPSQPWVRRSVPADVILAGAPVV